MEDLLTKLVGDCSGGISEQLIDYIISDECNVTKYVVKGDEGWLLLTLVDYLMLLGDGRGRKLLHKMYDDEISGTSELGEAMENAIMRYGNEETIEWLKKQKNLPAVIPNMSNGTTHRIMSNETLPLTRVRILPNCSEGLSATR